MVDNIIKLLDEGRDDEAYELWKSSNGKYYHNTDIENFKRIIGEIRVCREKGIEIKIPKLPRGGIIDSATINAIAMKGRQAYLQEELLAVNKEQVEQLKIANAQSSAQLALINQTLEFVLNSMGANFQRIERQHILENQILSELLTILTAKDEGKLKTFIKEHGMDSIGLILQVISFFTGN